MFCVVCWFVLVCFCLVGGGGGGEDNGLQYSLSKFMLLLAMTFLVLEAA